MTQIDRMSAGSAPRTSSTLVQVGPTWSVSFAPSPSLPREQWPNVEGLTLTQAQRLATKLVSDGFRLDGLEATQRLGARLSLPELLGPLDLPPSDRQENDRSDWNLVDAASRAAAAQGLSLQRRPRDEFVRAGEPNPFLQTSAARARPQEGWTRLYPGRSWTLEWTGGRRGLDGDTAFLQRLTLEEASNLARHLESRGDLTGLRAFCQANSGQWDGTAESVLSREQLAKQPLGTHRDGSPRPLDELVRDASRMEADHKPYWDHQRAADEAERAAAAAAAAAREQAPAPGHTWTLEFNADAALPPDRRPRVEGLTREELRQVTGLLERERPGVEVQASHRDGAKLSREDSQRVGRIDGDPPSRGLEALWRLVREAERSAGAQPAKPVTHDNPFVLPNSPAAYHVRQVVAGWDRLQRELTYLRGARGIF
jgi:hypothetical protein